MTTFDFLNDIVSYKQGDLLKDLDAEQEFVPFMLQRWLSMYADHFVNLLNNTTNRFYQAFDNKEMWYKVFLDVVPKSKVKRIQYLKKAAKEKAVKGNKEEVYQYLAQQHELSIREVKAYVEQFDIDLKQITKSFKD